MCRRRLCEHQPETLACPGGEGGTFLAHQQPLDRASTSFTEQEIEILALLLTRLRIGSDLKIVSRTARQELASVERKVLGMRRSLQRRAAQARG